jgi:hypothetical protein
MWITDLNKDGGHDPQHNHCGICFGCEVECSQALPKEKLSTQEEE